MLSFTSEPEVISGDRKVVCTGRIIRDIDTHEYWGESISIDHGNSIDIKKIIDCDTGENIYDSISDEDYLYLKKMQSLVKSICYQSFASS